MSPISSHHRIPWAAPARALLWEFCRRGWWRVVNAQVLVFGASAIVYSSILRSGPLDPQSARTLHFVLLWILFVASAGAALAAQGELGRFYRLPLSNAVLAAVTLFPSMVCVAATYLITAALLNGLYGAGWPTWGPALFFAASLGAIQLARLAAGTGRLTQFTVWGVVAVLFEHWLRGRYGGGGFLLPKVIWTTVTWSELLAMVSIIGAEVFLATCVIARDRRGDHAVLSINTRWTLGRRGPRGRGLPRFRNAKAAQCWFEWRQKGLILPGTFAAFATFVVLGCLLNCFDNPQYELLHAGLGYGLCFGPIALVAGLVLGHVDLPQAKAECDSFLGARPATNAFLSTALLKVEGASLLVTWGLWIAGISGATALLYFDQGSAPVVDLWTDHGKLARQFATLGYWHPVLLVGMGLAYAWIPLTLMSSLVQTGRQRLLVAIVSGSVPTLLLGLFLAAAQAEGRPLIPVHVVQIAIGVAAGVATVLGFALARRKSLIGRSTCGAALTGWLTSCGLAVGVSWLVDSLTLAWLIFAAGALALLWAPLAAGPLALEWNRHR